MDVPMSLGTAGADRLLLQKDSKTSTQTSSSWPSDRSVEEEGGKADLS